MHLFSNNFIYKKADKQRRDQRGDKQQQIFISNNVEKIILQLIYVEFSTVLSLPLEVWSATRRPRI